MTSELIIRAAAKINLGLNILGRRDDGYHELESVMQQISLYDILKFIPCEDEGISFYCSDGTLSGPGNLVVKAAKLLLDRSGLSLPGVRIELYKNIPVAAGLAGGSSDAAAALLGLNRFWKLELDEQELMEVGALLGSDVPYCLRGGTALVKGRGEILESLPDLPFFWVLLAIPAGDRISTAEAYRTFDRSKLGKLSLDAIIEAVKEGRKEDIKNWLAADFTNTLETADLPGTREAIALKKKLKKMSFPAVLSGSGPSLYILTDDYNLLRNAAIAVKQLNARFFLCWTINSKRSDSNV